MIKDLCAFLDASPVNFLAVAETARRLEAAGFSELRMDASWAGSIRPGARHYVVKNGSAIFAFIVGNAPMAQSAFHIISSHCDSPGFRVKPNAEILCDGGIVKLNTEVYGGPILYTWFDRPLSLAGRVILRSDNPLRPRSRLMRIDAPILTIPHLAIHFNRAVNEGNPLSRQKDMLPVLGHIAPGESPRGLLRRIVADACSVPEDEILDFDLSLYDTTPANIAGLNAEFISSGRLDDLSMVHASLSALLACADTPSDATRVIAVFDNEETGSGTKQGAGSPMLDFILRRIAGSMGASEEDYFRALARSFMISADNAHGVHPNYPEKHDPTNHPTLGGGPCIKINANCKYMTDADSAAVFRSICEQAGVPCQDFVNHSDVAGGSTLGNILTSQIPLPGVDMGAPLWAMHSVRETASCEDHFSCIRAFSCFFSLQ
ncbi:MAG: M18 family aminopeptidase [Muribaculaceae bacterium]|nr:M18 family aminopeptidase [Muribaculaceae bacterium]